jgi:hypothetical protein
VYLRQPPRSWTLLWVLGPWPWYLASAAVLAVVVFLAFDAPVPGRQAGTDRTPVDRRCRDASDTMSIETPISDRA